MDEEMTPKLETDGMREKAEEVVRQLGFERRDEELYALREGFCTEAEDMITNELLSAYRAGIKEGMERAAGIVIHERPLFGSNKFQEIYVGDLAAAIREAAEKVGDE